MAIIVNKNNTFIYAIYNRFFFSSVLKRSNCKNRKKLNQNLILILYHYKLEGLIIILLSYM